VRAAPVVQGEDLVILSAAGHVTVINRRTGDEVIKYQLKGNFSNPPSVAGPDLLVFATEEGHLYGVERVTGQIRWEHDLGAAPTATGPVRGRGVFYSPKPKELVAIDFTTGDVIYHVTTGAAEGVASRDRIFFARGRVLAAFAPAKGSEGYALAWSFMARGRILAGPVVDRGSGAVYIGDEKGNLYRLEAND
jgi:outer membrane protein assembly factor BamB